MFIGTRSSSTILDVLRTGLTELVRQQGLPEELSYKTNDCEMQVRGADLNHQIDIMRVAFRLKNGTAADELAAALERSGVPAQVQVTNGTGAITVQNVDWRNLAQYAPMDQVVEQHVARSL